MDYLIIRLVTKTNENYASLEEASLEYAIKLHEHLDIQEYLEDHLDKKQETMTNPLGM
jgi:hypothetical protein